MHEARLGADDFAQVGEEGDDVVLGGALDLVDAGDVEACGVALFPDVPRRFRRNDAKLGQRGGGMRLDLEPDAKAGLGRPDGDHFGAGIARNHGLRLDFS